MNDVAHELCKVLIVDDEPLTREGIKHFLNWEKEGFQIIGEASDGKEALEIIKQKKPHIVITDIVMPRMTGKQLTKMIKKRYPKTEVLILSSFSDFEYVRSTFQHGVVDYILKPELESSILLKTLKRIALQIPGFTLKPKNNSNEITIQDIIIKLFGNYELDPEDITTLDQFFPYNTFSFLAFDFNVEKVSHSQINDQLTSSFNFYIQKNLMNIVYEKIPVDRKEYIYLINFDLHNLNQIKNFTHKINKKLPFSNYDICWILSEPFNNLRDANEKFQKKLMPLLNYRFFFPEEEIIIYDQITQASINYEEFQLVKFTENIKLLNFKVAFQYLEDYLETLKKDYTKNKFEIKSFLGNIVFNITILLGNLEYDIELLQKRQYEYIEKINQSKHIDETIKHFNSFLAKSKKLIQSETTHSKYINMQHFLDYIDENYRKPLTLSDLAKQFHYNPSYISNYFRENNQQGFTQYLNEVRIKNAMKLLKEGTIPIAEISSRVGYRNHSYFSRVFKNQVGMSPRQLQRQYFREMKKNDD